MIVTDYFFHERDFHQPGKRTRLTVAGVIPLVGKRNSPTPLTVRIPGGVIA
jgi:hypothetical protein